MNDQTMLKTVLVVDDDPSLTELFDELLSECFNTRIANSVATALTELSAHNIDAIVCDYNLGIQNAEVLIDWLLEKRPSLIHNFILLTGDTQLNLTRYKHAFSILHKPVRMETLLTSVETLFDQCQRIQA